MIEYLTIEQVLGYLKNTQHGGVMNGQLFSIGEAIKDGWRLTKEHLSFLIGYQLILYFLILIFSGAQKGYTWAFWHYVGFALIVLVKMGLYNSVLMITQGVKPEFDQMYRNWRLLVSWFVAGFIFGVAFVIGLILLIAPGCYVLAKYGLFPFFLLDQKLGSLEALKQTEKASTGILMPIFLLFLACGALNLLGLLFFGVGLLLTIPTTLLALATVYRKIVYRSIPQIEPADKPYT